MPSTPHGYIRQESDIEDPSDSDDESDVYDDGPSGDFVDPSMVQKDGFCQRLCRCLCPRRKVKETGFRLVRTDDRRTNRPIVVDEDGEMKFLRKVSNVVASTKYTVMSFVPLVFAQQFKFFFNFFFLVLAVTQSLPPLRVGPLFTYIGPLVFVLLCTMLKEASDDIKRWRRDKAVNSKKYTRVNTAVGDLEKVASADIKVGDVLQVLTNERVPADMILLRTEFGEQEGKNGQTYIRTDQLDGEKDWKPRKAPSLTQDLEGWRDLCGDVQICAKVEAPQMSIYKFLGRLSLRKLGDNDVQSEALGLENTLWANTVVTHGPVYGLVVYTGVDSRTVMSYDDNASDDKTCLLDKQVDFCAKVCFAVLIGLSFMLVLCRGLRGQWWIFLLRYIVLLSYIIPISLRVNLDMAKTLYASRIGSDSKIPGTVARNSAIVEDLGTIDYVLTDKTGTLTKNDMVFKKLRVPAGEYSSDADTQQISMVCH
ncbi:cation-transporting ATPase, putative [Perkinsus marinus ATCC 50983]|uniref:Cation-transporting ATPase, putative n=1 Tax=Perkinsus marinus (strain ATCC 50983 / TXsc) TaxID=423536 RepID=C5LV77_PERM5|nr:cation-transporting ATPase, putative [Perkinsus marinus ATCC 50983]EEQ99315.1 cation-transporting ATPase, putative [Perkinsus marinus ATCC 50983]|eukprot:XP_002766598.1 cation-transporting ATPase, putative [Perkinsus marinus ATCC 50983]